MKKIFLAIILLINLSSFAQQKGMIFEHDATWQQILDKAKKENKFIFLDAYASWCGPCKWMSKEVFPRKEVGEAINPNYINAKIDMEKGEGIELAKKYDVRSYPTYLFFDSNGNLVHRSLGSMPAEDFIKICRDALNPDLQYVTQRKKYLSGNKDTAFLRQFTLVAADAQDILSQISMIEFLDAVKYELTPANIQFIHYLTGSLNDTGFSVMKNNEDKFIAVIGKDAYSNTIEELVWSEARRSGKKGENKAAFRKVIEKYLPEKADALCAEYEISLLKRAGNWSAYLQKAEKFATEFALNDWERLNDIANNFLENYSAKDALQKGLKISFLSVKAKPNYVNYLTTAELYLKLKDKANARKFAEKAIEFTKDLPDAKEDIAIFLKEIK